ncbi:MAG TPA: stimulus-sensing domain-containing protein [Acetobacteraceae bacterium]|nr:stimulus-sensing domain-containing protein [Acetobacteraceae bacterium]
MPDGGTIERLKPTKRTPLRRFRQRWVSPLLRRILMVNALPLALLVVALLYLDQYQNGLLEAEVSALREQAKIYAGAIGESAVLATDPDNPHLVPEIARPLLRRLTDPTPDARARLYAPDGTIVADSQVHEGSGATPGGLPLPPINRGLVLSFVGQVYDYVLSLLPHNNPVATVDITPGARGPDWQPDVKEELRLQSAGDSREMPPYIRRTVDNRLWITVAEPVERDKRTVGIVLLTREAREVEQSLLSVRLSIIALFGLALGLTVLLSWYLSLTIARPILRLADAASDMREGKGRTGSVSTSLLKRRDEVGELANAVSDSASALWARMDATEQFAADVAHELKNPLSSIRSAIETLPRIEDAARRNQLLTIIGQDVMRLDRLISDVSDASRVDAEMSRVTARPVDVVPIVRTLKELDDATRDPDNDPGLEVIAPPAGMQVLAVEDRLVQVLRNLIGNAHSFSPPKGRILVRVKDLGVQLGGEQVEISVEDQGPGIPEANLEHIFDRFYSERPHGEKFGQHSGLGLSISRQIVEALHGQISAENVRDASGKVLGARFIVRLPKANAALQKA